MSLRPGAAVSVPPLDDEARRRASRSAVEARRVRADWKGRLGSGQADLADLLAAAEDEAALAGMRVDRRTRGAAGCRTARVERILASCGIAPTRRLRGLGPNQRASLLSRPWGRQERA
jgi:hypothetical protein